MDGSVMQVPTSSMQLLEVETDLPLLVIEQEAD